MAGEAATQAGGGRKKKGRGNRRNNQGASSQYFTVQTEGPAKLTIATGRGQGGTRRPKDKKSLDDLPPDFPVTGACSGPMRGAMGELAGVTTCAARNRMKYSEYQTKVADGLKDLDDRNKQIDKPCDKKMIKLRQKLRDVKKCSGGKIDGVERVNTLVNSRKLWIPPYREMIEEEADGKVKKVPKGNQVGPLVSYHEFSELKVAKHKAKAQKKVDRLEELGYMLDEFGKEEELTVRLTTRAQPNPEQMRTAAATAAMTRATQSVNPTATSKPSTVAGQAKPSRRIGGPPQPATYPGNASYAPTPGSPPTSRTDNRMYVNANANATTGRRG